MLKMGLAVAGAIVARILAFTGYVANEPQQNSQTLRGIIVMFSLLPMVSYFISAYLVRYFKLNNAFLERIKTDLAKRELERPRLMIGSAEYRFYSTMIYLRFKYFY